MLHRLKFALLVGFNFALLTTTADLPISNGAKSGSMKEWFGIKENQNRLLTGIHKSSWRIYPKKPKIPLSIPSAHVGLLDGNVTYRG